MKALEEEARTEELSRQRASEQREQKALKVEDQLSYQIEAHIKQEEALRTVYQRLRVETMREVMTAIEDKRLLEQQERQFENDCHVLIQQELKARYDRHIQRLIRKEKSKNQAALSPGHVLAEWKYENDHLVLLSRLMRESRKHKTATRQIEEKHTVAQTELQSVHAREVTALNTTVLEKENAIKVLETSLAEEKSLLHDATTTINGEGERTAAAVTLSLQKRAEELEAYKQALPAMETQTDADEELLSAYANIDELKTDKEGLNEAINDLKYELESTQTELSELQLEFEAATAEYSDAVTTVRDHKDKSKFLTLKLTAADVEIERINLERMKIGDELNRRAGAQDDLEQQCVESTNQKTQMQQEWTKMSKDKKTLKATQDNMKQKIMDLRRELKESQAQIRQFQGDQSSPRPQIDVLDDDEEDTYANTNDEDENEVSTIDAAALSPDEQSQIDARAGVNGKPNTPDFLPRVSEYLLFSQVYGL